MSFAFPTPSAMKALIAENLNRELEDLMEKVRRALLEQYTLHTPDTFSIEWPECNQPYVDEQCQLAVKAELQRLGYVVEQRMACNLQGQMTRNTLMITIPS